MERVLEQQKERRGFELHPRKTFARRDDPLKADGKRGLIR